MPTDTEGHSKVNEPWRGWYKLARWQRLRIRVFVRENYTCQLCSRVTGRPIADHVRPHRGDPALFWSEANVQTLCKPCHDGEKQAAERRAHPGG
ncbi:MAG: HNH endonuclease [Caulobacterales bacterium]|nr:HNH endonuclease [Caulobacterales bacterium]